MNYELGQTYHNPLRNNEVEYYWIRPIFTYGEIYSSFEVWKNRQQRNEDIGKWVVETYGEVTDWSVPNRRWGASNEKYYFRDEVDRTLFILRWG
jgi:hypothetical protein